MAGDIERYLGSKVPSLRDALEDRFPQPSWMTEAGIRDRRNEGAHVVTMRQLGRDLEQSIIESYVDMTKRLAQLDAEAQLLSETKFRLERASRETVIIAGDNSELQAKFAVLDDDAFHVWRSRNIFGLEQD
jgi:hypothetical protein